MSSITGIHNIEKLDSVLKEYLKRSGKSVIETQKKTMLEINKDIILISPVDTGTAVNSVVISLNEISSPKIGTRINKRNKESEQSKTLKRNEILINNNDNFNKIFISTNVDYWKYIEEGSTYVAGQYIWNKAIKGRVTAMNKMIIQEFNV